MAPSLTIMTARVYGTYFPFDAPVEKYRTVFDGEVEAIRIALKQLLVFEDKFSKVVLFSDFQAAIQVISSNSASSSNEILQCRDYLQRLVLKKKRVAHQWIPGNCRIYENEQAHYFGRKEIPFHSVKLYIKQIMLQRIDSFLSIPNSCCATVAKFCLMVVMTV